MDSIPRPTSGSATPPTISTRWICAVDHNFSQSERLTVSYNHDFENNPNGNDGAAVSHIRARRIRAPLYGGVAGAGVHAEPSHGQ